MRRADREVTDPVKIREIITSCDCCRLGLCDGERAYVVPLDFGLEERDGGGNEFPGLGAGVCAVDGLPVVIPLAEADHLPAPAGRALCLLFPRRERGPEDGPHPPDRLGRL